MSSPRRSHSGAVAPGPSPRSAAASARGSLRSRSSRQRARGVGRRAGEQRQSHPALGERLDRAAGDLVREALVGGAPRRARRVVLDPGGRGDEHEALDPARGARARRAGRCARPSSSRTARSAPARAASDVGHALGDADGAARRARRRGRGGPARAGDTVRARAGRRRAPSRGGCPRSRAAGRPSPPSPAILTETTDTYLLLRAFVDELVRCGVAGACTSPGSRSTPLVLSLVRERRLRCWSHVDERVAGFFALGAGQGDRPPRRRRLHERDRRRPLPARRRRGARGARAAHRADRRPPARAARGRRRADDRPARPLRRRRPSGSSTSALHEATPERLRWMRALACRAVWTALGGRPGAVHLNFALREPLVLDEPLPAEEPGGGGRPDGGPWLRRPTARAAAPAALDELRSLARGARRGVIVAGRDERGGDRPAATAAFAEAAGLPLLADPLSGARRGAAAVAHYDALLRDDGASPRAGAPTSSSASATCRPPSRCARGSPTPAIAQVALDPEGAWQDPAAVVGLVARRRRPRRRSPRSGARAPRRPGVAGAAGARADEAAARRDRGRARRRPERARASPRALGAHLPAATTVVTASSMPVRDVETFWPVRDGPRACSPTAARTASTGRSRPPSAPPRRARPVVAAHRRRRARPRHRRAARGDAAGPHADDRARRQRRRRRSSTSSPSPRSPTPSRSTWPRRRASTPSASRPCSALGYRAPRSVGDLEAALRDAATADTHDADPRAHRPRRQRRAAPRRLAGRRGRRRLDSRPCPPTSSWTSRSPTADAYEAYRTRSGATVDAVRRPLPRARR